MPPPADVWAKAETLSKAISEEVSTVLGSAWHKVAMLIPTAKGEENADGIELPRLVNELEKRSDGSCDATVSHRLWIRRLQAFLDSPASSEDSVENEGIDDCQYEKERGRDGDPNDSANA